MHVLVSSNRLAHAAVGAAGGGLPHCGRTVWALQVTQGCAQTVDGLHVQHHQVGRHGRLGWGWEGVGSRAGVAGQLNDIHGFAPLRDLNPPAPFLRGIGGLDVRNTRKDVRQALPLWPSSPKPCWLHRCVHPHGHGQDHAQQIQDVTKPRFSVGACDRFANGVLTHRAFQLAISMPRRASFFQHCAA